MKEELFKVGSRYADESGRVIRLHSSFQGDRCYSGIAWAEWVNHGMSLTSSYGDGYRTLATGRDESGWVLENGCNRHLIPGELHNVNGQWLPISASAPVVEEKPVSDWDLIGAAAEALYRTIHPADEAMLANDLKNGPAKPYTAPAIVQAPKPSAHPCIPALCLSPDTAEGYRLGGRFGTAL